MSQTLLFVSGYAPSTDAGIRVFDATDPLADPLELARTTGVENPSYLALHPTEPLLYAVSEVSTHDASGAGALVAYRIDMATAELEEVGRVSSHGAGPCHVSIDATASVLYCANYGGGSVSAHALDPDGSIGAVVASHRHVGSGPTGRQEAPHAHCMRPAPDGSVHAVDLGTDEVIRYAPGPSGTGETLARTSTLTTTPGAGPRHLAFHPSGTSAVLVCELDNTVMLLEVDPATGELEPLEVHSTRAPDAAGDTFAAAVAIDAAGRFAYVSNRGDDTIAVFRFDPAGTSMTACGHLPSGGRTPRTLALHPLGRALLVANQDSDNLVLFELDDGTDLPRQRLVSAHRLTSPTCLVLREVPT